MYKVLGMIVLAAALMPVVSRAQSPDDRMCRNGLFADDDVAFSLARVGGSERLYFQDDSAGCPARGEAVCRQKAYVVPGDVLVLGKRLGMFRCAFYPNKVGGSAGWIAQDRVEDIPVESSPSLARWSGAWVDGDDRIHITVKGAVLHAQGEAWWPSKHPLPTEVPGGANEGSFEGSSAPDRNVAIFTDGVCKVRATLVNALLVVSDNRACGGMNVRFAGIYRRKP